MVRKNVPAGIILFYQSEFMRKAIVVTLDINALSGKKKDLEAEEALSELNQHLAEGWIVDHAFPMSGTGNTIRSASVVILEKH